MWANAVEQVEPERFPSMDWAKYMRYEAQLNDGRHYCHEMETFLGNLPPQGKPLLIHHIDYNQNRQR